MRKTLLLGLALIGVQLTGPAATAAAAYSRGEYGTVIIVEKSGPQLRITVKDTKGQVLLDRNDF